MKKIQSIERLKIAQEKIEQAKKEQDNKRRDIILDIAIIQISMSLDALKELEKNIDNLL